MHKGQPGKSWVGAAVIISIGLVCGVSAFAQSDEVEVSGDRVNLRAKPELTAEVVGQVEYGDRLVVRAREGDWAQVEPPDYVDMWVHREFVEDGGVTVSKLNVRGGPGINYQILGELTRGDPVEVRGEFGDWLRIAPLQDASVWIHADYVRTVLPSKPEIDIVDIPRPEPEPEPEPKPERNEHVAERPEPDEPTVRPPDDLVLVPLEGQGERVEIEGVVRRAGFLIGRPSPYRLIQYRGNVRETVCFIRGNERQLEALMGENVILSGRKYWVQGVRHPVVVAEQLVHRPH